MDKDKELLEKGLGLPLMERFYSIQGEGFYSGSPAYFIRLGGCDVGCHWCDVKESWNSTLHPLVLVDTIVDEIPASSTVVVTGGEPLTWNLDYLCASLKKKNIKIHIETSGSHSISGAWDWVCLSPKKIKKVHDATYPLAHELKIIIYNKSDFQFAEEEAQKVSNTCKLYLQPEWSKVDKVTPLIVDYIKKNTQWRVSIQTHKTLGIP